MLPLLRVLFRRQLAGLGSIVNVTINVTMITFASLSLGPQGSRAAPEPAVRVVVTSDHLLLLPKSIYPKGVHLSQGSPSPMKACMVVLFFLGGGGRSAQPMASHRQRGCGVVSVMLACFPPLVCERRAQPHKCVTSEVLNTRLCLRAMGVGLLLSGFRVYRLMVRLRPAYLLPAGIVPCWRPGGQPVAHSNGVGDCGSLVYVGMRTCPQSPAFGKGAWWVWVFS